MYNLKSSKGSYKGFIGECMFKLTRERVVLTKFFSRPKYFAVFGKYLNKEQYGFLGENWYSLDAIEIMFRSGQPELILYEIKTKNKYPDNLPFNSMKQKMTLSTHDLYNLAKTLGFTIKIATVYLEDGWDYSVRIYDFDRKYYCIDKDKAYDKKPMAVEGAILEQN